MHIEIAIFFGVFILGELIINLTVFKYIKKYFERKEENETIKLGTPHLPYRKLFFLR